MSCSHLFTSFYHWLLRTVEPDLECAPSRSMEETTSAVKINDLWQTVWQERYGWCKVKDWQSKKRGAQKRGILTAFSVSSFLWLSIFLFLPSISGSLLRHKLHRWTLHTGQKTAECHRWLEERWMEGEEETLRRKSESQREEWRGRSREGGGGC